MAVTRAELLYWTGSVWANARYRYWNTGASPDEWASHYEPHASYGSYDVTPIIGVNISDSIGNPRRGTVNIMNRPRRVGSATAGEQIGRFTGVFTDFQDVRIRDGENGSVLLEGRIYNMEEEFNFQYGNILKLDIT